VLQYFLAVVPTVDPDRFTSSAVELERSDRWRYGYISRRHDSVLVKAKRFEGEAPFVVPVPRGDLTRRMSRELHTRPWKATGELVFYAVLFGAWRAIRSRVHQATRTDRSGARRAARAALSAIFAVTLVMMPFLIAEYGEPARYAPLAGPAVSYGIVLASVLWLPLAIATHTPDAGGLTDSVASAIGVRGTLWLLACFFWAGLAVIVSWFGLRPHQATSTG
jgi:hypothetical protein